MDLPSFDPEKAGLIKEVKEAHLQSAKTTAKFWLRTRNAIPTEGTARFGPFTVKFLTFGIGVYEGKDIRAFIPQKE